MGAAGDFRAWDKFDVDAALDKVDAVNLETEEHRARKLQEHIGNEEKEKGNVQFKAGKYFAAIECYTRGMVRRCPRLDPPPPVPSPPLSLPPTPALLLFLSLSLRVRCDDTIRLSTDRPTDIDLLRP